MNPLKDQLVAVKMTVWEKSVFTRRANAKGQTLSQLLRSYAYLPYPVEPQHHQEQPTSMQEASS